MHYTICPICKVAPDSKGFCGCEPPFSLSAIPQEKIDGIARTIYPRILAYFEVPENKANFEIWLEERNAKKAAMVATTT